MKVQDVLNEAKSEPVYAITWSNNPSVSGLRRGKTETFAFGWFSTDGGYDREDRAAIKKLKVGEKLTLGDPKDEGVVIERLPDGTTPTGKW